MDKAKKKLLKRYLTWAGIAGLVLLLTVMPLLAKQEAEADGPVASVLSAQVTRGDIPRTLRGGGTLEALGEMEVNIPTGVKITEFLVRNGDTVAQGDPVARVDKVSVMTAITQVMESMEYLREELEDSRDEQVAASVVATAGGRVKKIFVWPGDDIQDIMLRRGALALLSIDGLMAVKVEADIPVTTGESVVVQLSGGTQVTGRVDSNLNRQIIITVEDEGYAIGEAVTVYREDGTLIGKGDLYVHNAWKAVAYSGTIQTVHVKEEQVLSSGATLFTLTDRDYEGQMNRRASQHREYEELLQRLMAMYESGVITAPCEGTVSGVDEDSAHLLAAEEVEAEVVPLGLGDMGTVRLMLLSGTCTGDAPKNDQCTAGAGNHRPGCPKYDCLHTATYGICEAADHGNDCIQGCKKNSGCTNTAGRHQSGCYMLCAGDSGVTPDDCPNGETGNHKPGCIYSCSGKGTLDGGCSGTKNHYQSCIGSCDEAQTETDSCDATGPHKNSCIRSCVRADMDGICRTGPHYLDCIGSCTGQPGCPASKHLVTCALYGVTYTATVAKVQSVGNAALVVFWDASGTQYPVEKTGSGWRIIGGQFNESLLVQNGTLPTANAQQFKPGDIVLLVKGEKNGAPYGAETVVLYRSGASQGAGGGIPNFDMGAFGSLSAMVGGFSGFGGGSSAAAGESENLYDLKGSPLMTITRAEGYQIDILLDERDIDLAQVGMEATIRVEAVRGQTFRGTVTRVGTIGTHQGGSGKFQVRVQTGEIPGSLPGMSSMVRIHLDTREDVLVLPVEAVSQEGARTIVYTALDSKTGEPTAPVEITTGASDGAFVEIMGLDEGTSVYYYYYDVLEIDDSARERQFNLN